MSIKFIAYEFPIVVAKLALLMSSKLDYYSFALKER